MWNVPKVLLLMQCVIRLGTQKMFKGLTAVEIQSLPAQEIENLEADRIKFNAIICIWSGKLILGEVKPSPNITLPDRINMILVSVLSNKGFIIPAHVVHTRSIASFID